MYSVVKIGGHDVPMEANASTPIRYKQLFHRNLLPVFRGTVEEDTVEEMLPELAFIMAMSAAGEDMNKLSYDRYIAWLEQFGALDFFDEEVVTAIRDVYIGNLMTDSEVKKIKTDRKRNDDRFVHVEVLSDRAQNVRSGAAQLRRCDRHDG